MSWITEIPTRTRTKRAFFVRPGVGVSAQIELRRFFLNRGIVTHEDSPHRDFKKDKRIEDEDSKMIADLLAQYNETFGTVLIIRDPIKLRPDKEKVLTKGLELFQQECRDLDAKIFHLDPSTKFKKALPDRTVRIFCFDSRAESFTPNHSHSLNY